MPVKVMNSKLKRNHLTTVNQKQWYLTISNQSLYSPTVLCQRLTANKRLQVTVTTAGIARWGNVLAATWVTGELEGNFSTMMTSCCICSLNMSGLCGRKHWWRDRAWRRGEREHGEAEGRVRGTEGWREEISRSVVVNKREGRMEKGKVAQGKTKSSAMCEVLCPEDVLVSENLQLYRH